MIKKNVIKIPKDATNGEMWLLVFGGKVKGTCEFENLIIIDMGNGIERVFSISWWNSLYNAKTI